MKKLLILALITILLTLAGCTKNNTSSGGVSSADNIANSFVEENISSEIETENSEDTDISEPKETTSEENKTKETNSTVSNESVVENNSSTTNTTTKKEEVNSTTSNTNSSENNNTASNTSSETSEPEIKTIRLNELTTYFGYTGFFARGGDFNVFETAKKLGLEPSSEDIEKGIKLEGRQSQFIAKDNSEVILFYLLGTLNDAHSLFYDYIMENGGPRTIQVYTIDANE